MYKSYHNIYSFLEIYKTKHLSCPFIEGYSKFILRINSIGTLKTYIPLIHKFWLYSIYFPPSKEQSFPNYMWEYRERIATKGFLIKKNRLILGDRFEYDYKNYEPSNSVKIDMIALKSYFNYIFDELNNENFTLIEEIPYGAYGNALNYNRLRYSEMYSKNSSYGLKPIGIMRDALAVNISIFDKLIKSKKHIINQNTISQSLNLVTNINEKIEVKNFPLYAFKDFLYQIKNPRDKLLYIICGCLGARKSQALNLTFYDVDVINEVVYLTDPTTNEQPRNRNGKIFMEQEGRRTLLKKYYIYPNLKPHSYIRFKYSIPSISEKNRELKFLPGYKNLFFKTYSQVLQTINTRNNPFIFQTKTGGRYLPSSASTLFNKNIERFQMKNQKYDNFNLLGDLHSLRHMYGVAWADIAYYLNQINTQEAVKNNIKTINTIEILKNVIAKKMGITSDAINIYFNQSEYTRNQLELLMDEFGKNMMGIYEYIKNYKNNTITINT